MTNMSRAFWRADVKREPLQRVYAITFPDNKQLKEYQHRMEEVRGRRRWRGRGRDRGGVGREGEYSVARGERGRVWMGVCE